MPSANCENTAKGKDFQVRASDALYAHFGIRFALEVPIAIGRPAKNHYFDLVSNDSKFVGECKNFCWTETGKMPSAKMASLNEAVLYLSLLPSETKRFIVLRRDTRDTHEKQKESLAEYYYRTYKHLLDGIFIIEFDVETGHIVEIV